MGHRKLLFVSMILTVCSSPALTRAEFHSPSPAQATAPGLQKASIDSAAQFLLTSAAADFRAHGPAPAGFRDVRIGHDVNPNGESRYILCGQFLLAQDGGKAQWVPFATIKTSGYEQYVGAQAATFCQGSSFIWDDEGDLSSTLQSRFDSLREK